MHETERLATHPLYALSLLRPVCSNIWQGENRLVHIWDTRKIKFPNIITKKQITKHQNQTLVTTANSNKIGFLAWKKTPCFHKFHWTLEIHQYQKLGKCQKYKYLSVEEECTASSHNLSMDSLSVYPKWQQGQWIRQALTSTPNKKQNHNIIYFAWPTSMS